MTELANNSIYLPAPYANPRQDSTGFFYSICKCEHRHVSALEREDKALLCAWRHRRNSFCVCCASGESLILLFMALLFRHRCSAVCVFHCSSRHSWLRVFVFALSHTHTHTHFSASKTNTQLHEGSETQKHYANETGTAVPFFSLSLSLSFNTSRLISFIPLKTRQAETVNANISLREIRSIFTNPSYPSCQNVMCDSRILYLV